eukprot:gnl/MRDRNA2_/MRDRNA2_267591_c0_seq1.p1 gnl/MRDRNA2_/MRDRNA2_267591_c0~~gnl/MRDRNA2_/MRDRNA2_267591_c0_seq1.p1  ORF type:complete len:262 (+),score=44.21 gnl/MRDRNA2_/MRDRNA2_267591_c0_seq1:62-787(+)
MPGKTRSQAICRAVENEAQRQALSGAPFYTEDIIPVEEAPPNITKYIRSQYNQLSSAFAWHGARHTSDSDTVSTLHPKQHVESSIANESGYGTSEANSDVDVEQALEQLTMAGLTESLTVRSGSEKVSGLMDTSGRPPIAAGKKTQIDLLGRLDSKGDLSEGIITDVRLKSFALDFWNGDTSHGIFHVILAGLFVSAFFMILARPGVEKLCQFVRVREGLKAQVFRRWDSMEPESNLYIAL